ncbi:hypothetical protein HDU96_001933 [Phlyctochytrium bullatum]|nr:hypothetical protein HDU96_001933 [Phlyctochytrium bullatum]
MVGPSEPGCSAVAAFRRARRDRIKTLHLGRLHLISAAMAAEEAELARMMPAQDEEEDWTVRMSKKKWSRPLLPSSITHPLVQCLPPLTQITTLELDASSLPGLLNLPPIATCPQATPEVVWRSANPSAAPYASGRAGGPHLLRPWLESLPKLTHLIVNCTVSSVKFDDESASDVGLSPPVSRNFSAPSTTIARPAVPRLNHLTLRLHGPDSAHQGKQSFALVAITLLSRLPPTRTLVLDAPHAASPGMAPGWLGCPPVAGAPASTDLLNPFAMPNVPVAWAKQEKMAAKAVADALKGIESLVLLTRLRPPPEVFPWKPVLTKPHISVPVSSTPPAAPGHIADPPPAQPVTSTSNPAYIAPSLVAGLDELQDSAIPERPNHTHVMFSGGYSRSMTEVLLGPAPLVSPVLAPLIPTLSRASVAAATTVLSPQVPNSTPFSGTSTVPVFASPSSVAASGIPMPQSTSSFIPPPEASPLTWEPARRTSRPTTLVKMWLWQSAGLMASIATNLTTLLIPSYEGLPLLLARLPANPPMLKRLYVAGSMGGWGPGTVATADAAAAPMFAGLPGHELAEEMLGTRVVPEERDASLCHAVLAALAADTLDTDTDALAPAAPVRLEEADLSNRAKLFPLALSRLTSLRAFGIEDWHRWSAHLLKGLERLPGLEVVGVTCKPGDASPRDVAERLADGVGMPDEEDESSVRLQRSVKAVLWTEPPGSCRGKFREGRAKSRDEEVEVVEVESVMAMRKCVMEYKRGG